MNRAYIILVNYNGHVDTIECLESLLKIDYSSYQILVVDNSDTDSVDYIKDWGEGKGNQNIQTSFKKLIYPLSDKPIDFLYLTEEQLKLKKYDNKILIIKAKDNRGFAAGNNIALNYILKYGEKSSFSWLLNNDTVVPKNTLKELVVYYNNAKNKLGILGSKLICYDNPKKIQAIGGKFNTMFYQPSLVGEFQDTCSSTLEQEIIDYAIGASMFVSNSFLHDIGILSEDYFLYYEELDWSFRAKRKGWTTDWCPTAIVYHKEGKSIGTSSDHKKRSLFSQYYMFRSRRIFCNKYFKISFKFYLSTILISLNRLRRLNFSEFKIVLNSLFKTS